VHQLKRKLEHAIHKIWELGIAARQIKLL